MSDSDQHLASIIIAGFNWDDVYDQAMLSEIEYEHADKSDWIIALQLIDNDRIQTQIDEWLSTLEQPRRHKIESESKDQTDLLCNFLLALKQSQVVTGWDNNIHGPVYNAVINQLSNHGITPSTEHENAIRETIITLLGTHGLQLPTVLPVPPGYGKTTILKELIVDRLNRTSDWCALIVLDRVDDIFKQIAEVRSKVNNPDDIAFWPTFTTQLTCPAGLNYFQPAVCQACQQTCPVKANLTPNTYGKINEPASFKDVKRCPAGYQDYRKGRCNTCPERNKRKNPCPAKPEQPNAFTDKRVMYITHEFYYRMVTFEHYRDGLTKYINTPRQVIIDERPRLVKTYQEHLISLLNHRTVININMKKRLSAYDKSLLAYISQFKDKKYYADSIQPELDRKLISDWETVAAQNRAIDPEGLLPFQMLLENGGYYEPKSYDKHAHATTTAKYLKPNHSPNRTVVLDGTGQFDDLYDRSKYYIRSIANNLQYPNLHFHFCKLELSKYQYGKQVKSDKQFIQKLCSYITQLAGSDPTLVLCYKEHRPEFERHLGPSNIWVEHFGNVLGKNDYSRATNVVFAGVQTYPEADYGAMDLAVNGMCYPPDIPDRIKQVELNQKLVHIYQQIYRTKLRYHNPADEIHVYLPTKSDQLQKLILARFKGAITDKWLPQPIFKHGDLLKQIVQANTSISKYAAIRSYVRTTNSLPTHLEIKVAWPGISKQHATNLRKHGRLFIK